LASVERLKPVALIEDKPSTVARVAAAGFPVLAPAKWNYVRNAFPLAASAARPVGLPPGITLYATWGELVDTVTRLAEEKDHHVAASSIE
jgi:hypothetical protein